MKKRKFTHCKHCKEKLEEWQAWNAESCQDIECIKDVARIRNKKQRDRIKSKKDGLK